MLRWRAFAALRHGLQRGGGRGKKFKLGMAVGGNTCCEWMKAQGEVARALAEQRGWDYVELSNNNDPATTVKNADIFIQEGVNAVIQFNGQPSVNPVLAQKLGAAKIPVITYDIAQKGFYFVGIDNLAAGHAGGEALGEIVKEKWNCEPDLVISAEGAGAGIVNTWRTGGMREGLKKVCPNIPADKWVSFESRNGDRRSLPAARDSSPRIPTPRRWSSSASMTVACSARSRRPSSSAAPTKSSAGARTAPSSPAPNVNPHLAGSVFYFLEGYAVYALRDVIDKIAAGSAPPVKDDAGDPASRVEPCPVSAAEAAKVPDMPERVKQLLAAPAGTTEFALFCPKK